MEKRDRQVGAALGEVRIQVEKASKAMAPVQAEISARPVVVHRPTTRVEKRQPEPSLHPRPNGADAIEPRGGEARMLQVLAQHYPQGLREAQWALLSKLKRTGGTWSTYRSRLKGKGYTREEGGLFYATDAAIEAAGVVPERPQTTAEVISMWRSKPGMAPAIRLVEAALKHPEGIDRDELGILVGLEPRV